LLVAVLFAYLLPYYMVNKVKFIIER